LTEPVPIYRDEYQADQASIEAHLSTQDKKVDHLAERVAESIGWSKGFAVACGIIIPTLVGVIAFLLARGG
jgi:hypothetical protein